MERIDLFELYLNASDEIKNQIDELLADHEPRPVSPESHCHTAQEIS